MNIVRSFKRDSFKDFLNHIRNGDIDKVKTSFHQEFINKRILDEPNGLRPIHLACEGNSEEIVKFLIDRGCDFEQRTNESLLPIHIACISGSIGVVDILLKKKSQLEIETKEKYRPVHYACKHGNTDVLLLLLNHKCSIVCQTIHGYTPLHLACEAGKTDTVRILLTYNCPMDVIAKNGLRPIDLARNNRDIIALFAEKNCLFDFKENNEPLEAQLDIDNLDNYGNMVFQCIRDKNITQFVNIYDSQTPIMNDVQTDLTLMEYAISEKAYEFVELILDNNPSAEKFEKYFIHFKEKNADIFDRILVEYSIYRSIRFGVKTDFKSLISIINQNCILTGTSFLEIAVKYGSAEHTGQILTKLIQRNESLWNKVTKLAQDNLNYEIYKLITDREKYLETRNEALWTRLHIAVDDNDLEMIKYLLKTEQDLSTTYLASVGSPLNLAAICGRIEAVKLLISKMSRVGNSFHVLVKNGMSRYCVDMVHSIPDINEIDENGDTLLHLSAKYLSVRLTNMLLEQRADPNIVNKKGNTPLHEMVLFNFPRIKQIENDLFNVGKLLLDNKTDINIVNKEGVSIFHQSLLLKDVRLIVLIMDNQDRIQLTRMDLKIIMDNNWISILELVLPQATDATQFIDEELLIYFLKNRSPESFNSTWFLADPEIRKNSVTSLLYQCALDNKTETFSLLSEESTCSEKLFDNGETLLTFLLKNQKQDLVSLLIDSNLSWTLVNQCNSQKETPLHIAAKYEYFNILENMLYIAENINQEDCNGNIPFSILINNTNPSEEVERIAKLIISKSVIINEANPILTRRIENCDNNDLRARLTKVCKKEMERKTKTEEIKNVCNVCLDNVINVSFGCGHTSCDECASRMKICPICRGQIRCRNALFL